MAKKQGKQTILLENAPCARAWASVVSKKEKEGPLGALFDIVQEDSTFGQESWEKAESRMVTMAVDKALQKAALTAADIDCVFAGDLINQFTSSTFGLRQEGIPLFGIYGACSTMTEGLVLASLITDGLGVRRTMAVTSSHFCTAERQYRYPLEYGGVRPPSAQWTATAAGAVVVECAGAAPYVRAVTVGAIEDKGVKDQNNMGAAMAPAAASTMSAFFRDMAMSPNDFDMLVTGDLGAVGSQLFVTLMQTEGYDVAARHADCGLLIYDRANQDVHAGGSGCGCSASVLCARLLPEIREGKIKNLLFMSTGALLSPLTVQQKESIPGIAHLVWLSCTRG